MICNEIRLRYWIHNVKGTQPIEYALYNQHYDEQHQHR